MTSKPTTFKDAICAHSQPTLTPLSNQKAFPDNFFHFILSLFLLYRIKYGGINL